MKNKYGIDTETETALGKTTYDLGKTIEIMNKMSNTTLLELKKSMELYQDLLKTNAMGVSESLREAVNSYNKINLSYLSRGAFTDSMFVSFKEIVKPLKTYSKIGMSDSLRSISFAAEELSKSFAAEQIKQLQQIDFTTIFASIIPKTNSISDMLQSAYTMIEDDVEEDSFTEEEIQEILKEHIETPVKFQERVAKWTEKKILQYYIVIKILSFIWGNFFQPYFQEHVGKPVVAYVISNVKELPEKSSKIIGMIHENKEAVITENVKYYYKVTFTDEKGEKKEGYVAKRNLKIKEGDNQGNE